MATADYKTAFKSSLVELFAGAVMVIVGVILQVQGSSSEKPSPTLTVTGGVLTALGGVLLSWMASRVLAEKQAQDAAEAAAATAVDAARAAEAEVDEKLNNLSRVLGQAAGQISQAVEKVDSGLVSEATGFELISQANRMIYGQVNEIAVIRNSKFDPGFLSEIVSSIGEVTRELSSSAATQASSSPAIASALRRLESLSQDITQSSTTRSSTPVAVTCPYCDRETQVVLGSTPGDTATNTCPHCAEVFNAHRNAAGAAFTRRRGPRSSAAAGLATRWMFKCPTCQRALGAQKNGNGERLLVCPKCFSGLRVDPGPEVVVNAGTMKQSVAVDCHRSGSRPRTQCPECGSRVNLQFRYDAGFFGFCAKDMLVLTVTDEVWADIATDTHSSEVSSST